MKEFSEWVFFILAGGMVDGIKIARYMRLQTPDAHSSFLKAVLDYYVGGNSETFTCVTTCFVGLSIAAMYINRVGVDLIPFLDKIPQHAVFAGLLGSLSAYFTPRFVKWLESKFFPGGE